eukprot:CAMPEP_0167768594 /NCGR_PEP_ID=MMETSP0110_2-20121227/16763_1 /TAXON_ID=629695 /ORGANISM="Gymnochlora sp., Strain CCMP2014" /LENGTH=105 /DNA_ID=CAMNT_0007657303 /DNA_START=246 /DNA_END=563 /DNA_ORIENTATION=+
MNLALHRLKTKIAVEVRYPYETVEEVKFKFPGTKGRLSTTNKAFPLFVAQTLDIIAGAKGQVKPAADAFGVTSSAMVRLLFSEKSVVTSVQKIREANGLRPLKSR